MTLCINFISISHTFHTSFTCLAIYIIMTELRTRYKLLTIALAILLPCSVAATWFGKGFYDRIFMLEGHVVVVNATASDHEVEFEFPSGQRVEVDLKAGATQRTLVGETGEGSVKVTIDGTPRESVGYVMAMNGMLILTIGEDRVVCSCVSLR